MPSDATEGTAVIAVIVKGEMPCDRARRIWARLVRLLLVYGLMGPDGA